MKRIIAFLLFAILLFTFTVVPAKADGEGNLNGGGGDMGGGTGSNFWNNGDDGVRVTVVRASDNTPVSNPIDLTNKNESGIQKHFVRKSKLHYKNGSALAIDTDVYRYFKPSKAIPTIITGNSTNNIPAIKKYFCSEWVARQIAEWIGSSYDTLINGKYKLLLEPIGYFTFNGNKWAMTATEAAKYDLLASGGLRAKMVSLSHQNLPLSMFLQTSDMGYPAYSGSTTTPQDDAKIIAQLGLGIVKFKGTPEPPPVPGAADVTYRTDTDVVTAVTLSSSSEINPDHAASVSFHIGGGTFTMTDIVMPAGESQLAWVKWHTPSTPQTMTISVNASKGSLSKDTITAKIENLNENTPPNPTATDRNDSFKTPSVPQRASSSSNTWGVWNGYWVSDWKWHEHWVWHESKKSKSGGKWVDEGQWQDDGKWHYNFNSYRATLSSDMSLMPDDKDPTADGKKMKSGYGVKIDVDGNMDSSAPLSNYTCAQTAVTYFPEFEYNTYWRLLDLTASGGSSSFAFKTNKYSTYDDRVHFTPLWYPDGTYTAYTYLEDAWTPAGMLSQNLTDSVTISGNVYDDWFVARKMN